MAQFAAGSGQIGGERLEGRRDMGLNSRAARMDMGNPRACFLADRRLFPVGLSRDTRIVNAGRFFISRYAIHALVILRDRRSLHRRRLRLGTTF